MTQTQMYKLTEQKKKKTALGQRAQIHTVGKIQSFQQMVWGKVVSTFRRIKLDPYFIPQTHINPKYIKILNIRPEGVKLPDKSIREKLYNIGMADNVFDINLKATKQNRQM